MALAVRWCGMAVVALAFAVGAQAYSGGYGTCGTVSLNSVQWDQGDSVVRLVDLNQDGFMDVVTIGDHGNPYINTQEHGIMQYLGDGNCSFAIQQYGTFGYGGVSVGDLDLDGVNDAAWACHHNYAPNGSPLGTEFIQAALNKGSSEAWEPYGTGMVTDESWGMFETDLADVNGDGLLDLGANSFGSPDGVHVVVQDKSKPGSWQETFAIRGGNSNNRFNFGDCNNDGKADFSVSHSSGAVYVGTGTGQFSNEDGNLPSVGTLGYTTPVLGDVNADGTDELVFVTSHGGIAVYTMTAPRQWSDLSGNLPSVGYQATAVWDMDVDGYQDVVAYGNGFITIFSASSSLPLAAGADISWTPIANFTTFTDPSVPPDAQYSSMAVRGDLDHNGYPDIVLVQATFQARGFSNGFYNDLIAFREGTPVTAPSIAFLSPVGNNRKLTASPAQQFVYYAAAIPPQSVGSATVTLSIAPAANGPFTTVAASPPTGRFQVVLPGSGTVYLQLSLAIASGPPATATSGPLQLV